MKYKYYGTAAYEAIPALFCDCEVCKRALKAGGRNIMSRSQSIIDDKILIDFPADTYMHMLQGLPLSKIHTCLITHNHSDHLCPYDMSARYPGYGHAEDTTPMDIYSCRAGIELIDKTIDTTRAAFPPADNMIVLHEICPFESFTAEGYEITPLAADHGADTDPVIYLIKKDGKCLLHANDTGYFPEETWEYLKENPVHMNFVSFDATLVMNAPANDRVSGHMNLPTVNNVRNKMRDMGLIDDTTICAVNHFSHNGLCCYDDLVKAVDHDEYIVAYDGLEIEF